MKNFILFFILSSIACAAEDIGAVIIGVNNYINRTSEYSEISSKGVGVGILLPVKFPNRPVHVKLRAAFHNVDDTAENPNSTFLQIANIYLIGYKWIEKGNLSMLPQIGLGVQGERLKIAEGTGGAHMDMLVDFAFRVEYAIQALKLGLLINFERDFNTGYGSFLSPNRLNVSLVISK